MWTWHEFIKWNHFQWLNISIHNIQVDIKMWISRLGRFQESPMSDKTVTGLLEPQRHLKGILHQKIFYRLNLIFWIVMGCGIADFDRRGL